MRQATDTHSAYRPMTQSFFCNFERVHEDKTKRDTATTVQYFQFNYTIQNFLLAVEVVYCFLCMLLFLMIVYWVQEGREEIVVGINSRGARIEYTKRRQEMTELEQDYEIARAEFDRQIRHSRNYQISVIE